MGKEARQKMTRQFGQLTRYSDAEMLTIKNAFADNEDLLFAIRKVFLQFELSEREQKLISSLSEEELTIIRKEIIPEIDPDAPLLQMVDLWSSIDFKNQDDDKILREMKSRQIMVDYLEQMFGVLTSGVASNDRIEFKSLVPNKVKANVDWFPEMTNLSARNSIMLHINLSLNFLKVLAGMKSETVEETKARLAKDSNK